ncbi:MAG: alkaline phosphatase family protein [Bacteroidetes bacterium]|nr:alkaline phosphatase family protein [Bacteroidota bacterium]
MKRRIYPLFLFLQILLFLLLTIPLFSQNIIIVVIDGARYTETIGTTSYMPYFWKYLKPKGTLWTNFWNEGITRTQHAHASLITGAWQTLEHGSFVSVPTLFELYRKEKNLPEHSTAIVVGKEKLEMLSYSRAEGYGVQYRAPLYTAEDDRSVIAHTLNLLQTYHPQLVLIHLPDVDHAGHTGNWEHYIGALRTVDSLVYILWTFLQSDSIYHNTTTLFLTNDHGRHDDNHGGISDHGCECDGCRRCMLFAIGDFSSNNSTIQKKTYSHRYRTYCCRYSFHHSPKFSKCFSYRRHEIL